MLFECETVTKGFCFPGMEEKKIKQKTVKKDKKNSKRDAYRI